MREQTIASELLRIRQVRPPVHRRTRELGPYHGKPPVRHDENQKATTLHRKPLKVSDGLVFGQSRPEFVLDKQPFGTQSIQADQVGDVPLLVTRLRLESCKWWKLDTGPPKKVPKLLAHCRGAIDDKSQRFGREVLWLCREARHQMPEQRAMF